MTGAAVLTRYALRRDRRRNAIWVASIAFFFGYASLALNSVYPTAADRSIRAAMMSSPAAIMMTGPGYGLDNYTLGAMVAGEMTLLLMIAVAIMNIQLIVRNTRADEESGRSELIRAAVVGRHAPAAAAFAAAILTDVAIALTSGAVLAATGLTAIDSLALGCAVAVTGAVFAAVAVVTSQLTAHSRTATGMALSTIAVAWLLDAVGNIQQRHGAPIVWLSPFGWGQQIRAYVDLRWWPLALAVGAAGALLCVAAALGAQRDFGAGLLAPRAGRAQATRLLHSPLTLAVRLQRGTIIAWSIGLLLFAAACGTFVDSVTGMLDQVESPLVDALLRTESTAISAFLSVVVLYLVLAVASFAIVSASRARTEETAGRLDPLLAAPLSRSRWLGAQFTVTGAASLLLLLVSGVGLAVGAATVGHSDPAPWQYVLATLLHAPAVAIVAGVVWAAFGWAPRCLPAAWVLVIGGLLVGVFGALLRLPEWVRWISPFAHIPAYPASSVDPVPVLVEVVIAAVLTAAGFLGFRRRDIA